METNKKENENQKKETLNKKSSGTDIPHNEQLPEIPEPVIKPSKESIDPNELLNRA